MRKRPRCRVCGSVAGALGTNRSAGGGELDRRERPVHAGLGDARDLMLKRNDGLAVVCLGRRSPPLHTLSIIPGRKMGETG